MASVKEILETSKKNIVESAYMISDIMKYRYQNPAVPLSSAENEFRDILAYVYGRTGQRIQTDVGEIIDDASTFPAGMIIHTNDLTGVHFGTRNAYNLDGGRIFTGTTLSSKTKKMAVGTTGTCKDCNLRITSDSTVEYTAVAPETLGTNIWVKIPAFVRFKEKYPEYMPIAIISNDHYFAVLWKHYDQTNVGLLDPEYAVVLSPDLWQYSKPCLIADKNTDFDNEDIGYQIYIDKYGRIFYLNEKYLNSAQNSTSVLGVYDNPFKSDAPRPFGLSYAVSGLNRVNGSPPDGATAGFIEDLDTHTLWFFDWINNIQYEVLPDSSTEGFDNFEVPAVAVGSVVMTQAAMQITDLGFAPDKVYVILRSESATTNWYTDICLTRDTPNADTNLGYSYRGSTAGVLEAPVKTISSDIQTTKYGGYISKDGFVIHLGDEYVNQIFDYIAIGRAAGNDPYLS